ncbi:MAG: hypothetical protein LBV34_03695 [Nocardiopsaceae bacterium]|nr:hypothetical protein [Nocardiopsaceae bacterium]
MTDHRDPVEAWLSADVDLMLPPPGTFERVHRRARHRKAMKGLTAAAGAAVVIAGGVVIPQFAGGLGTNHPGPAKILTMTPEPRPTGPPPAVAIPGPPLSRSPAGPPPAAGFQPTSVTFIGASVGAVLGVAGSCAGRPCTAMAATHDYGKTWSEIKAPPAGPADGRNGVSQVRFLDLKSGWAYGPALYATHDGGKSWRAIYTRGGRVIDLSTVGRRAFAVVAYGCTGAGAQYASGCKRFTLFSTAASSNEWDSVSGASGNGQAMPGGLQLTSRRGYLVAGGRLYAGPIKNGSWQRVPGTSIPGCMKPGASGPRLIAPATGKLFLVCQDPATNALTLYRSAGSGSAWDRRGVVRAAGTAQSLAVTPSGSLMLATTTGIYRSADGRSWKPVFARSGGFSFVGMTNEDQGVAVAAGHSQAVYITTDAGRTWQARPIR